LRACYFFRKKRDWEMMEQDFSCRSHQLEMTETP
jgi:hypothetical protein